MDQAINKSFPVVCIGASAGGLEPIIQLLENIPVDTGMAFVCIQHLDPTFKSLLSVILGRVTLMPVSEVEDGMSLEPNHVYVIPPDTVMTVFKGTLKLVPRSHQEHESHLCIDAFLCSLAKEWRSLGIGIILSGVGRDGTAGVIAVKKSGGATFAQDEKSSKYQEMPHNANATGCVDFVLSPKEIALKLISLPGLLSRDDIFSQILFLLKRVSGIDFFHCKTTIIKRRIVRRMFFNKKDILESYLNVLKNDLSELELLCQDVLISVTRFFRDSEIFKFLQSDVFPKIAQNKSNEIPLRIWVPACSTGEEVYSLALRLWNF